MSTSKLHRNINRAIYAGSALYFAYRMIQAIRKVVNTGALLESADADPSKSVLEIVLARKQKEVR